MSADPATRLPFAVDRHYPLAPCTLFSIPLRRSRRWRSSRWRAP